MYAWLLIRRLRGPSFLILVGFTALLNQWGVLSFSRSWPLYLILAGIFGLAERAALASAPALAPPLYPASYGPTSYVPPAYPATGYAAVPPVPTPQPAPPQDPLADPDRRS